MSRVVQFFALPTSRLEPTGEHQFIVMEDGRVFERFVYVQATPHASGWIEVSPPVSDVPNVPVAP